MGAFIKKDIFIFWRDRKELLLAFSLPLVIIIVINLIFSETGTESLDIHVALVQEDDELQAQEEFAQSIAGMDWPEEEGELLLEQAALFSISQLMDPFFAELETEDWLTIQKLSRTEAEQQVENGEIDAILAIPAGFTYNALEAILLNQANEVSLMLQIEEQSTEVYLLQEIIQSYLDELNFQFALQNVAAQDTAEVILPQGGREYIEGLEPFSDVQYITIGISVFFSLFLAFTIATKTLTEKRELVFNRIILSNRSPLSYLMSKVMTTFIIAWVQLALILSISHLLLNIFPGKSLPFWLGGALVISLFSLCIAGLAALFSSLLLRLKNGDAASGIIMFLIMFMGFLGGSFFPLDGFPRWLRQIGEWTPNGNTLRVLLEWIQFGRPVDLIFPLLLLLLFFICSLVAGTLLLPRRGRI